MKRINNSQFKKVNIGSIIEIPFHWNTMRLKDLGYLINGISKGKEYFGFGFPFVSYSNVYNDAIEIKSISTLANSNKDEQRFYSVKEGDVFFTRTSETLDEIGIASTALTTIPQGIFSGFVIRLRPKKKLLNKFYSKYLFRAHFNKNYLSKEINLVTRASLNQNVLANLTVILPPLTEQTQIANYLDAKTQAIDKKVNLLTQKINYYKELRKTIINDTVTKGLNKGVSLKDSGIEWIGKIPKHWEVRRLKTLGNIETSSVNKRIEENEQLVRLVNYTDVYGNANKEIWNKDNYMIVSANALQVQYKKLKQGDVLFTPSSETVEDIGVSAVVMENLKDTLYSYHLLRFRFLVKMYLNFKKYLFNNSFVQSYFSKSASGTTRKILGLNTFYNLKVAYPTSIEEQAEIAKYLDKKTSTIDAIVINIQKQIETLKELRKTLINDAVTGKVKVST